MTAVADMLLLQARAMSEDELTENVRDLAKTLRLQRFHTYNSRHSPAGWVDEVLVGPRGVLFRELKKESGRTSPAQKLCIGGLHHNGLDVDVWRPYDWLTGRIQREMRAIA